MAAGSMAIGSMVSGMVGSLFAGVGQAQAGKDEQAAYDYNADITMLNTGNEMVTNEQRYSALVGKQATAYAASGVDITRGSPLLMMAATAGRGGRQAAEIYQAGSEQATLERYYGKIAAWKGKVQGIQTFLSGMNKSVTDYLKATDYAPSGSGGDVMQNAVGGAG